MALNECLILYLKYNLHIDCFTVGALSSLNQQSSKLIEQKMNSSSTELQNNCYMLPSAWQILPPSGDSVVLLHRNGTVLFSSMAMALPVGN